MSDKIKTINKALLQNGGHILLQNGGWLELQSTRTGTPWTPETEPETIWTPN